MWFSRYLLGLFVSCYGLLTILTSANAQKYEKECYKCISSISNLREYNHRDKDCENSPQPNANLINMTTYKGIGKLILYPPFQCEVHLDSVPGKTAGSWKRQEFRRLMHPANLRGTLVTILKPPEGTGADFQCLRIGKASLKPKFPQQVPSSNIVCFCTNDTCNGELTFEQMTTLRDEQILPE